MFTTKGCSLSEYLSRSINLWSELKNQWYNIDEDFEVEIVLLRISSVEAK